MKTSAIVVTGASGGIGSGVVEGLLRRGYKNVAGLYHTAEHAEHLKAIFSGYEQNPLEHIFQADITQEADVKGAVDQAATQLGPIMGLINCAGTTSNGLSWKLDSGEFLRIQKVNLLGPFHACKAVLPKMREQSQGRIVNISSILSVKGMAGTAHYSASKAGLNGMTRALAAEVAAKGITVNSIALGYFDVGMIETIPEKLREEVKATIPKKRFGHIQEVVALVDYLLGDDADYITGQVIHINGGLY